jgi:GNAT superfamily N-acetyltransferase
MSEDHDQFWANFFGVSRSDLNHAGTSIVVHAKLAGYCGVWFFKHADRLIVSAPEGWFEHLQKPEGVLEHQLFTNESFLKKVFGGHFERSIGPAYHGSLEPTDFRPVFSSHVRALSDRDGTARAVFEKECGLAAWEDSGLDQANQHLVAHFENERITAMAGYRPWNDTAGDPCVLVHPDCRARGLGTVVVSEVIRLALLENNPLENKVLLYQTLESNIGAVRLAQKLGYQHYASHLAVRLTANVP